MPHATSSRADGALVAPAHELRDRPERLPPHCKADPRNNVSTWTSYMSCRLIGKITARLKVKVLHEVGGKPDARTALAVSNRRSVFRSIVDGISIEHGAQTAHVVQGAHRPVRRLPQQRRCGRDRKSRLNKSTMSPMTASRSGTIRPGGVGAAHTRLAAQCDRRGTPRQYTSRDEHVAAKSAVRAEYGQGAPGSLG